MAELTDEKLLKMIEKDKARYLGLGRASLPLEEQDQMSEAAIVRHAIEEHKLYNQVFLDPLRQMVYMHNWIRCYVGVPVGKSEWDIDSGEPILVIGVQAPDILLGLNMNRTRFTEWFIDHMKTLGFGDIPKEDVKYFNLNA